MEKLNFVKNGVLRLPPGFRFHPTDEELVDQYLKRKVYSCPLPASIIPEVDVCKSDPWDLPGDSEEERYFFSTKEAKYPNGNRSNRATGSGYWKATGIDKKITTSRGNQVVGMKKTLVFYRGKPPHGSRTDWIMHEYRLVDGEPPKKNTTQSLAENWVICRIFLKKRSTRNEEDHENTKPHNCDKVKILGNTTRPVFYDFLAKDRADLNLVPASSSSGSSGVTEVFPHEPDDREESSSCNSFSSFRRKP
ncbi:NAC domain-containing protein [Actinidia chinensis var. chinensis]|uniref:NAC domain-containing protein n=1 Tax=Actinidia chinensis var. chinensis TaxID=1590841 RepID=A0A2R6QRG3_ACTCC|nr:NAC domain-containing protein [Actinidia chinensis var. chinensis]